MVYVLHIPYDVISFMYHFSAIAELEDSNNLEHFANPFTVSSSDSFESFSDSTFDSCDSWSSDNSYHSGDEGPPNKPLPQPPERKKKVSVFLSHQS